MDRFHEWLDDEMATNKLSVDDAYIIWRIGLSAYKIAKEWKARFPHDPTDEHEADMRIRGIGIDRGE
jgi:hypothetical protein